MALALVGRKGRDFFLRRGFDVRYEEVGLFQNVKWSHAQAIANTAIKEFLGARHRLGLSGLQRVQVDHVAAGRDRAAAADRQARRQDAVGGDAIDYLFEPSPEELLDTLLPFHVAVQVNRALLESSAAEHAARMTAMDSATRNAQGHGGPADAVHEQGAAGGDYARDHRDRRGRAVGVAIGIGSQLSAPTADSR